MKPSIQWIPANSSNYTVGRERPISKITFHHVVGSDDSAISRFQSNSQVSAHFVVGDTKITQMVDLNNTAWCNANWNSNNECITIEHEGDWRNGYRNEAVINNSAQLVAWLRSLYPNIGFNRHRDVYSTLCPADLPVEEIWNKATEILNPPKPPVPPAPPTPALQVNDVTNKIVITNKDANLWNLSFTTWAGAQSVKVIPKGTEVEISATAKHPLGGTYYLTEYSFSKGIMNGINVKDCDDKVIVPPPTIPPVVVPTPPPVVTPPVVPPVVEPDRNAIIAFLTMLRDLITEFIGKFKKG